MTLPWQLKADRLAREGAASGKAPTEWFEPLYAAGERGEVDLPWDKDAVGAALADWLADRDGARPDGSALRAVVVGSGLGREAALVASRGYVTSAFDVSPTAVRIASSRHPEVEFVVADLFDLPAAWVGGFDLVVEQYTVQALPIAVRPQAVASVASLVAPGGTAVVVQAVREDGVAESELRGPPWPLSAAEVRSFTEHGLALVALEQLDHPSRDWALWRGEFIRPMS